MYSTIIKSFQANLKEDDAILIDNNERIEREIELLRKKRTYGGGNRQMPEAVDGFQGGLEAEQVDALLSGDGGSPVIRQEQGGGLEEAQAQAEEILKKARAEAEQLKAEAVEQGRREAEEAIRQACDQGRREGYENGYSEGMAQVEDMRKQLKEEERRLKNEYLALTEELEPEFVRTITKVYEQVFRLDLQKEHDIVLHLIDNMMQKMEGNGNYLIHVSKEDYSYVSRKKEELLSKSVSGNASVEVVEDVTLGANDCMIETENGIFDCGLGTQLEELSRKLKLLSYSGE